MFELKAKEVLMVTVFLLGIGACTKLCNSGYEGKRCNELSTTKFLGSWSAVDTPGNIIYIDTITQGAVLGDIILSASFAGHHFNHVINASVIEAVVTIPSQQPDSGGNFVTGTGLISDDNNHLSITYQIISGADTPQVVTNYGGNWTLNN